MRRVSLHGLERPDALAIVQGERRWTWAELAGWVAGLATGLTRDGVQPGDRLGVVSDNRAEVVALFFAAGRVGASLVVLNQRLTAQELQALAQRARLARCYVAEDYEARLAPTSPWPQLAPGEAPPLERAEATAAALFTSGTTGTPSLVELTWGNFVSSAEAARQRVPATEADTWLLTLPLCHVGGLAMVVRWALAGGVLVVERGFDEARVSQAIDDGATQVSLVAVTLQRLLEFRGARPAPSSLRAVLVGGGPVPPSVLQRARALGFPVLQTYGLTEACSQVCTEAPGEADGSSAGTPLPGIGVEVRGDDGRVVGPGEVGRIWVSGPTLAKGLGPWHDTRDFGRFDTLGRLQVLARREDLIVSGGENVYPAEVEGVLATHPQVLEVAVLPVPHAVWGQAGLAAVVVRGALTLVELERFARGQLAGFKVPAQWRLLEALPRTAAGKVDRPALRRVLGT